MDEVAGAIAAAVEQQTATTRELAASIRAVSGTTDQTAHAMEAVACVADDAGGVSREVLSAAETIGHEAENLRSEVTSFLATLRDASQERRRYERISANGAPAVLRVPGHSEIRTTLKDLSRGGAALVCDLQLVTGTELDVELPGTDHPVTARVVRYGTGAIVVSFHQDPAALAQVDRALDTIAGTRRVA
jgi:methyl-accepting chemotaxis protein